MAVIYACDLHFLLYSAVILNSTTSYSDAEKEFGYKIPSTLAYFSTFTEIEAGSRNLTALCVYLSKPHESLL